MADLFPWDEPNYGIDEQWARIYPYGQQANGLAIPAREAGQCVGVTVKILNHSSSAHTYTVRLNVPEGFESEPKSASVCIEPREEAQVHFKITVPQMVSKNLYVITCDVEFDKWHLRDWCESLIEIHP